MGEAREVVDVGLIDDQLREIEFHLLFKFNVL